MHYSGSDEVMTSVLRLVDFWQYKLLLSTIVVIFAPFKIALLILFIMIFMDTLTGCIYAFKVRRFSSGKLRRGLGKLIIYTSSIVVVRLLEIGIYEVFKTTTFTNVIISYLVLTESLSVLENLTLLGAPLPMGLKNIILSQIKNNILGVMFKNGIRNMDLLSEILDMINYQLPPIKNDKLRLFLKIKLEEWSEFIVLVSKQFANYSKDENKELIYLRVTTQISFTLNKVNERCVEDSIPKSLIDSFNKIHDIRIEQMINDIRRICYEGPIVGEIREKVCERVIVYLYQNIVNAHKIERTINEDNI